MRPGRLVEAAVPIHGTDASDLEEVLKTARRRLKKKARKACGGDVSFTSYCVYQYCGRTRQYAVAAATWVPVTKRKKQRNGAGKAGQDAC